MKLNDRVKLGGQPYIYQIVMVCDNCNSIIEIDGNSPYFFSADNISKPLELEECNTMLMQKAMV